MVFNALHVKPHKFGILSVSLASAHPQVTGMELYAFSAQEEESGTTWPMYVNALE